MEERRQNKLLSPYQKIKYFIHILCKKRGVTFTDEMEREIPTKWEIHGDLLLLPDTCFKSDAWHMMDDCDWSELACILKCSRVAQKSRICSDSYRSPRVNLILGSSGWVHHIDNGIRYSYDVTKCMFSRGNISEKLRIALFDCQGETVLDLFAGIGYFVLPYLLHARAAFVHACEWNPDAVEALQTNLKYHSVEDRCHIHEGDNRLVCPRNLADRVNLGLIPSSQSAWYMACAALRRLSGGILHIHGNIETKSAQLNQNTMNDPQSVVMQIGDLVNDDVLGNTKSDLLLTNGDDSLDESATQEKEYASCNVNVTFFDKTMQSNMYENPRKSNACRFKRSVWTKWAERTRDSISEILFEMYAKQWSVVIVDLVRIKKYAPHIDHMVVDLECRP